PFLTSTDAQRGGCEPIPHRHVRGGKNGFERSHDVWFPGSGETHEFEFLWRFHGSHRCRGTTHRGSGETHEFEFLWRFPNLSVFEFFQACASVIDAAGNDLCVAVGVEFLCHANFGSWFPVSMAYRLLILDGRTEPG